MRRPASHTRTSLIPRRWRNRFGITAPRVTVRAQLPWYWWALTAASLLLVVMLLAARSLDAQTPAAEGHARQAQQLHDSQRHAVELAQELARVQGIADAGESRVQIERAAQQQLIEQVKRLEIEIARLKDDLAVFESLAQGERTNAKSPSAEEGKPEIKRLRVEPLAGEISTYRYRMLLTLAGAHPERVFKGELQLVLRYTHNARQQRLSLPEAGRAGKPPYAIQFKYFQRIEGDFDLPAGARLLGLEVRVLRQGVLLARNEITL